MLLTRQNLRKLYACFVKLPPFNGYKMPAPHKVQFGIINTNGDVLGYFHTDPTRIEVDVSNDTYLKISETLMHEMIHCLLYYHNQNDFDQHEKKFQKYAKMVCNIHGFNLKDF
jgi:hypothetical protein